MEYLDGISTKAVNLISNFDDKNLNVLPFKEYPYLYLETRTVPTISRGIDFYGLFEVDIDEFINFCFETTVFGDATRDEIDVYLQNVDNHLEKFLYCYEEFFNINIVALSESWDQQLHSKVLVCASTPDKRFLINRKTRIIFKHDNQWFNVEYLDLNNGDLLTYDQLGDPFITRLKRLIENEYEKENNTDLYVAYEPTDIGKKLPKIRVNIGGKSHELLVGATYNLYLPGIKSILAGKIDIVDINQEKHIGKANIKWVEGFPGNLP